MISTTKKAAEPKEQACADGLDNIRRHFNAYSPANLAAGQPADPNSSQETPTRLI